VLFEGIVCPHDGIRTPIPASRRPVTELDAISGGGSLFVLLPEVLVTLRRR
jgi:hypothetical protein